MESRLRSAYRSLPQLFFMTDLAKIVLLFVRSIDRSVASSLNRSPCLRSLHRRGYWCLQNTRVLMFSLYSLGRPSGRSVTRPPSRTSATAGRRVDLVLFVGFRETEFRRNSFVFYFSTIYFSNDFLIHFWLDGRMDVQMD